MKKKEKELSNQRRTAYEKQMYSSKYCFELVQQTLFYLTRDRTDTVATKYPTIITQNKNEDI